MGFSSDLFNISGRDASVTGVSSGLGQHSANVLARAGAKVVGVARRADALRAWQAGLGDDAAYVAADLSDQSALADIAHSICVPFGSPDILVHAAGVNPRLSADQIDQESWQATLWLNLSVPFFLSQHLITPMIDKGWGRIINFASLQTRRAFPNGIAYGASKGGVGQLTRAMAEAWSHECINTNAIGPGFFPTELTQAVFDDSERSARNAGQTCIGRNGEFSDMDGPLLFLCSDASSYVSGQILMVDGGFSAK